MAGQAPAFASTVIRFEAGPLLYGVGEFGKAVGQLDTVEKQFKALGHAGVMRTDPGQRGL